MVCVPGCVWVWVFLCELFVSIWVYVRVCVCVCVCARVCIRERERTHEAHAPVWPCGPDVHPLLGVYHRAGRGAGPGRGAPSSGGGTVAPWPRPDPAYAHTAPPVGFHDAALHRSRALFFTHTCPKPGWGGGRLWDASICPFSNHVASLHTHTHTHPHPRVLHVRVCEQTCLLTVEGTLKPKLRF